MRRSTTMSKRTTAKRATLPDIANRIPVDALRPFFEMTLNNASKELEISATTLKRLCRRYGIKGWPYRKISAIDRRIAGFEAGPQATTHHMQARSGRDRFVEGIQKMKAHREGLVEVTLGALAGYEREGGTDGIAFESMSVDCCQSHHEPTEHNTPTQQELHHQNHQQHQTCPSTAYNGDDDRGISLRAASSPANGCDVSESHCALCSGQQQQQQQQEQQHHQRQQQRAQSPVEIRAATNGAREGEGIGAGLSSLQHLQEQQGEEPPVRAAAAKGTPIFALCHPGKGVPVGLSDALPADIGSDAASPPSTRSHVRPLIISTASRNIITKTAEVAADAEIAIAVANIDSGWYHETSLGYLSRPDFGQRGPNQKQQHDQLHDQQHQHQQQCVPPGDLSGPGNGQEERNHQVLGQQQQQQQQHFQQSDHHQARPLPQQGQNRGGGGGGSSVTARAAPSIRLPTHGDDSHTHPTDAPGAAAAAAAGTDAITAGPASGPTTAVDMGPDEGVISMSDLMFGCDDFPFDLFSDMNVDGCNDGGAAGDGTAP